MAAFRIEPVRSAADLAEIARLFQAYVDWLGIDLTFQDFAAELAGLPGKYAPPAGELLLARGRGGEALGCVAVRPLGSEGVCEMKRLYVLPAARGLGLGRALVTAILETARRLGYREMRLDTLPTLLPALSLYREADFKEIPAYYETPLAEVMFLSKQL